MSSPGQHLARLVAIVVDRLFAYDHEAGPLRLDHATILATASSSTASSDIALSQHSGEGIRFYADGES